MNFANVYGPSGSIEHFDTLEEAVTDANKALSEDLTILWVSTYTSRDNELIECVSVLERG